MGNRKDIGTVFKEQLNYLDKSPNENGWNAIQEELDKKKKRRILPFWYFLTGILFSGILFSLFNLNDKQSTASETKSGSVNEKNIFTPSNSKKSREKETELVVEPDKKSKQNALKTNKKENILTDDNLESETKKETNYSNNNGIKSSKNNNKSIADLKLQKQKKETGKSKKIKYKSNKNKGITNLNEPINDSFFKYNNDGNNSLTDLKNSKSKQDSIQEIKVVKKDSLSTKKLVENITKKDSLIINDESVKKITVFGYGSPTLSSFIGKNSVIDNRLNGNTKTSSISFSYGIYLCFIGNEKFTLRTGFGKNNLKFITKDVPVNVYNYSNIEYQNGFSNVYIYNQSNNPQSMNITQDISYTEIPLEAKYKFIGSKIGVNAILGLNYLILDKNEISIITSTDNKYNIGKTRNLLSNSLGINLGLGLDYKLSNKLKINIEPMFKYHLKDYQNIKNTNPFSFNILTGIEFKVFGDN